MLREVPFLFLIMILLTLTTGHKFKFLPIESDSGVETKVTECLVKIIENASITIRKISFFSSKDNSSLLTGVLKQLHVPVVINSLDGPKIEEIDTRIGSDFVIFIHRFANLTTMLRRLRTRRRTKFLLVSNTGTEMEEYFQQFWKHKLVNVFALLENSPSLVLYSFLPYQEGHCNDVKPIVLDEWSSGRFLRDGFAKINEEMRIRNMNRCPINVSVVHVRPMVIFPKGSCCKHSRTIDGTEARFMGVIAQKLNFTATYSTSRDGKRWGGIHPPTGVLGEVFGGTSDFALGSIAQNPERYENMDISRPFNGKKCMTFGVPKRMGKNKLVWLRNLSGNYSPLDWTLIFLVMIVVTLFYSFFSAVPLITAFLTVFASFLGLSAVLPKKPSMKVLLLSWLYFSLNICTIYEASLGSLITVPLISSEIRTVADLLDTNLIIMGHPNVLQMLQKMGEDPLITKIISRYKSTEFEVDFAVKKIIKDRNIAYLRDKSMIIYSMRANPNAADTIVPLTECVFEFDPVIVMRKNSPFSRFVDQIIYRISEAGLGIHWKSDFLPEDLKIHPKFEPFKIEQGLGIFTILLAGLLTASLIFFIEIGIHFGKAKYSKSSDVDKNKPMAPKHRIFYKMTVNTKNENPNTLTDHYYC